MSPRTQERISNDCSAEQNVPSAVSPDPAGLSHGVSACSGTSTSRSELWGNQFSTSVHQYTATPASLTRSERALSQAQAQKRPPRLTSLRWSPAWRTGNTDTSCVLWSPDCEAPCTGRRFAPPATCQEQSRQGSAEPHLKHHPSITEEHQRHTDPKVLHSHPAAGKFYPHYSILTDLKRPPAGITLQFCRKHYFKCSIIWVPLSGLRHKNMNHGSSVRLFSTSESVRSIRPSAAVIPTTG